MPADVAILIVTYNSEKQIGACLRSVYAQRRDVSQQVIVLDNASQDGTVQLIRREFPQVQLILPGKNLGFAAGVNAAAINAKADYLLLLNPDTEIVNHAVDEIVSFARSNTTYGIYGGRTLKLDGSLEPSSCWGTPSLWSTTLFALGVTTLAPRNKWLDPESLGPWPRDTVREVGVVTGCFLLVHNTLWKTLNGLDSRYFMYGEDVDFCLRARKLGRLAVICPRAQVIHEVGKSSATRIDKLILLYRGKAQLFKTHWHGIPLLLAPLLLKTGVALRAQFSTRKNLPSTNPAHPNPYKQLWQRRSEWIHGYE